MQTTLDIAQLEKKILGTIDIDKGPTFKAILLVRDPRAVSSSRENLNLCDWNNNQTCVDVPKLCNRLDTDVDTGKKTRITLCLELLGNKNTRVGGLGKDFSTCCYKTSDCMQLLHLLLQFCSQRCLSMYCEDFTLAMCLVLELGCTELISKTLVSVDFSDFLFLC